MYIKPSLLFVFLVLLSACGLSQAEGNSSYPQFIRQENNQFYIDPDQVALLLDEQGKPISTKITEDESLGTVHTFDLFPIVVASPAKSADDLWRVNAWISSGNSVEEAGFIVRFVLGFDDTVVEYDLLPGFVFEFKSGNTDTIANIAPELKVGDQIFVHVIGEHSFTEEDMQAISELGFDYPKLVEGHQKENMAILNALAAGNQPPAGEIRGVGLIYRGTE